MAFPLHWLYVGIPTSISRDGTSGDPGGRAHRAKGPYRSGYWLLALDWREGRERLRAHSSGIPFGWQSSHRSRASRDVRALRGSDPGWHADRSSLPTASVLQSGASRRSYRHRESPAKPDFRGPQDPLPTRASIRGRKPLPLSRRSSEVSHLFATRNEGKAPKIGKP